LYGGRAAVRVMVSPRAAAASSRKALRARVRRRPHRRRSPRGNLMTKAARPLAPLAAAALAACAAIETGGTAPDGRADCDRACLADVMTAYLGSVLANDASLAPLAESVRFTEDGIERAPGEGFWGTATALEDLRLQVLDPVLGSAVGLAVMAEGEQLVLFAFRLAVEDRAITEVETLVVKPQGENAFVNRETLARPRTEF